MQRPPLGGDGRDGLPALPAKMSCTAGSEINRPATHEPQLSLADEVGFAAPWSE